MIRLVEALNYRCLRYVHRPLGPFHVLVGPNASGKTTFLDVIAFLGTLVSEGLDAAVAERTSDLQDLTWGRAGDRFELAMEAQIPETRRSLLARPELDTVRYEVTIGLDRTNGGSAILGERVLLKVGEPSRRRQASLFPMDLEAPATLSDKRTGRPNPRTVIKKVPGGNDNFYSEVYAQSGKGWAPAFKLGARKSALGNMPQDETQFPVATWLRGLLVDGVQQLVLNSLRLRRASPPGQVHRYQPDGSNLPWVVDRLVSGSPKRYNEWIKHLRTALPDLDGVRTVERDDDKHRYLILGYRNGLEVPSWLASDGTLRLLALSLLAYLPDLSGVYLIEEPENGVHPRAIQALFDSLSSVYGAQVMLATHSPVILSVADPGTVLCFAKTQASTVDIVSGDEHPALKDWRRETTLGDLLVAGVLE